MNVRDKQKEIEAKIAKGTRLSYDDGVWLLKEAPLLWLMQTANKACEAKHGKKVFYNVNRHINPTNVCVLSCKFCAFSRKPGEDGSYAYTIEQMVSKADEAVEQSATEVHMVGGLHPRWRFEHYLEMIRSIKTKHPHLHIKAFTAVELDWFSKKTRKPLEWVLQQLVEAGLGSLPGGGAEIFAEKVRDEICDTKVSAEQWIDTHKTAHRMGLKTNATMLYGHIESLEDRVHHMQVLRTAQDDTSGWQAFIPLSFQPHDNEMGIDVYTNGEDDLRTIATARLFLDNFDHIKAYWVMLGQDIAQMALVSGANDLDGTVSEEKISRMAGGRSGHMIDRSYIHSLIEDVGKTPTERNTIYDVVKEFKQEAGALDKAKKPFSVAAVNERLKTIQPSQTTSFGQFFLAFEGYKKTAPDDSQKDYALHWQDIPFRSPQKSKVTIDEQTEVASDGNPIVTGARNGDPRFKLVGLMNAAGIKVNLSDEPELLQQIFQSELARSASTVTCPAI